MTATPKQTRTDRALVAMRWAANLMVLGGYFLLLNVDLLTGVTIRFLAAALIIPWMVRHKLWDSCAVIGVMGGMDLHKMITILLNLS